MPATKLNQLRPAAANSADSRATPLLIASYISVVVGMAMWWFVFLSVLAVRTRQAREPVPA